MERSVREVISGLGACGVLLAFLAAVPACLVRLVGNPLPSGLPAWSSVVAVVEGGAVPPGVLVRVVAIVVWIWWSQVALSFGSEVVAACRGRTARSLPLRGLGMQPVVVRLVAVIVTAASTLGVLAQPVLATTPSFDEISVPLEGGKSSGGDDPGLPPAPPALAPPSSEMLSLETEQAPSALAPARPSEPPVPILALPQEKAETSVMVEARVAGPDRPAPILQPPAAVGTTLPVTPDRVFVTDSADTAIGVPAPPRDIPGQSPPLRSESSAVPGGPGPAALTVPTADTVGVLEPSPAPQPAAAPSGESGWVVVKPGDSLWLLAERHLGDAVRWRDIYELNSGPLPGGGTLRDPNLIHPGWRLRLPSPRAPAPAGVTGAEPVALGNSTPSPARPLG